MRSQPIVETPRLILRGWTSADIEPFAEMNADPRVMEFFPSTRTRDQSYESAAHMRSRLEDNGFGWFVLERRRDPAFAGVMCLDEIDYDVPFTPKREIGWRLPFGEWGKGYATEAGRALLDYAFATLGWDEVVAFTAKINERSQRVMQRLGMIRDVSADFEHPRVPAGHPIRPHVLYRAHCHSEPVEERPRPLSF